MFLLKTAIWLAISALFGLCEQLIRHFFLNLLLKKCFNYIFYSQTFWWYIFSNVYLFWSILMCIFCHFFRFKPKVSFLSKIVSLSWNLFTRLIQIYIIQCWCSNLVQKIKTINLNWNLVSRVIRICRIQ